MLTPKKYLFQNLICKIVEVDFESWGFFWCFFVAFFFALNVLVIKFEDLEWKILYSKQFGYFSRGFISVFFRFFCGSVCWRGVVVGYGGLDVFYMGEMCVGGTFMSLYDTTFPFLRSYRENMGGLVTFVWYIY